VEAGGDAVVLRPSCSVLGAAGLLEVTERAYLCYVEVVRRFQRKPVVLE
jgi:hypothetical protein